MTPRGYAYRQARKKLIGQPCVMCGNAADQADHIFPLALGGTDDSYNLQPMCSVCNKRKGAKLNYRPSYINHRWYT